MKIKLQYLRYQCDMYLRLTDVCSLLLEVAKTEDPDVRHRLTVLVNNLQKCSEDDSSSDS